MFTVQSSLWLLGVVTELDRARGTQAALAVAEERLRFSRDVHDVLGRRLSTIAVQAELAATLTSAATSGPPSRCCRCARPRTRRCARPASWRAATGRSTSTPRWTAPCRCSGPLGVSASADLADLPEAWHEPMARVIREAVTNVLRHSSATRVEMRYADGARGHPQRRACRRARDRDCDEGTGLAGLAEHLAPLGAVLTAEPDGDDFVVRAELDAAPGPAGEDHG